MPILTQKSLVLAKVETTSGVDASPTATTDAFLVENPVFSVTVTNLDRVFARPDFSEYASKVGRKLAMVSFSVPLAGGATPGVSPTWARLLLGCSMAKQTVASPAGEKYTPITTGQQTLTLYVYYEGFLHKITGAMGTFKLKADAGQFATIDFTFTGLYSTPSNSTYPASVTQQDVVPPQVELAQLSFNSDATLLVNSFTYDMANKVVARADVNSANGYKATRISGRAPSGGMDPEAESTHTFWALMEASTLCPFTMTLGSAAGNQIIFAAPSVQITGLGYGDRDNLRNWAMTLMFRRATGNDEFSILFQ